MRNVLLEIEILDLGVGPVLAVAGQVREKEAEIFAFYDAEGFSFEEWKTSRR